MAATETITLNIQGNAVQQLQKIETQVGKLGSKFLGLRNILGGIAITSVISNTLKWADSIDDLSKATGLATNSVLGFSQALQLNGGDAESAQAAMNKFVLSIDEAATGGAKTQQAFKEVGVTLQDLATLSEQQLFEKTIAGLADIKDKAKAAATANELMGKSIRGTDWSKVIDDYYGATLANKKYNDAIKKGAETQENIEMAVTNLKLALLELLTPLSSLAKSINENIDSIKKWADIIWSAIKPVVYLFGALKLLKYIGPIFAAIVEYGSSVLEVITGLIANLGRLFRALSEPLTRSNLWKSLKELGGFANAAKASWAVLTNYIDGALIKAGAFIASIIGITDALETWRKYQDDFSKPLVIKSGAAQEMPKDFFEKGREKRREVEDANKKLNNSILEIRQNYEKARKATEEAQAAEIGYAMMAGDIAEQIKAQRAAYESVMNAVDDLRKKRKDLSADQEDQKKLIDSEIIALLATIPAATEAARARVAGLQNVKNAQEDLIKQTELMKQQLESDLNIQQLRDQIDLLSMVGDELEDNQIIMEVSQQLEQTLIELRKQELDLIAKKGQLTDEQFQKELAQINALREAASEKANKELDAKRQVKEAQRAADDDAALGIKKYLDELSKGVTPAKQALESVQSVFKNMDDALTTFVKTGKFKFKDFALSVIQDLILIQAKAALVTLFKTILGGFLAEGGPAKAGTPYIVGEKGPELFVPNQSGTVVPNNKTNTGSGPSAGMGTSNITNNYYNVNAVDAKSVAQLFAENRKALLGASRMAEREMPYAMGR